LGEVRNSKNNWFVKSEGIKHLGNLGTNRKIIKFIVQKLMH
jgi:hypothetical protein